MKDKKRKNSDLVLVSEIMPDQLIIIPISSRPVFPGITLPLTIQGEEQIEALEKAYDHENGLVGMVLKKQGDGDETEKLYRVGTVAKILKISQQDNGMLMVLIQGLQRFEKTRSIQKEPFHRWRVKYYYDSIKQDSNELKAYSLSIMSYLKELLNSNPIMQEQLKIVMSQISRSNPALLIDVVASMLNAEKEKLQDLLETFDLIERSKKLMILLKQEIELTQLQEDIKKQIEDKISKQQREFFLREQLKIIKKELGLEKDEKSAEIEKIEQRIKKLKLPRDVSKTINEELNKLKLLNPESPEFNVTRSYLNALVELPWGIYSKDNLDIKKVREILDEDHYGLQDVKNLILQFISTIIKRKTVAGSILCLVGPPGVGKTSVGKSIARAMNRKFFRFSLGGMRDEAEIKGHRRTYIGAMPGKIMQSIKRCGTSNPVIMLDEIDKVGKSFRGDPASALLEVLDPEQNSSFLDHYLDVHFDLSKVLFITTANQLDTIPRPLLDRMEVVKLSGYILQEKVQIAKRYLIPKQLQQHGLLKKELNITDKALQIMVDKYAREAGVRNLENQIKKIMRQVTLKQAEGEKSKISVSIRNLEEYLGKPIYTTEVLYNKNVPGVTLGLAWTSLGGTTLYVEAAALKSKQNGFKQTGQLGGVMKESSEIAFSYIRSLLSKKEDTKTFFDENFVHLHVPAGATPKDGPSAGITMALALYSLATGNPVPDDIAMTGELTITGKVLPIGGVKEKTIAARRVNVNKIILPKDNKKDFQELPNYIKEGMEVYYVDYFSDVLNVVY
ncbi:MAG: endopeptidase La [Candidatus Cloacimonadota bacterium]|nr:endopeptidase La [Candidatus Cloacimonadota bacterium]